MNRCKVKVINNMSRWWTLVESACSDFVKRGLRVRIPSSALDVNAAGVMPFGVFQSFTR
jgi:hypothetical protein